MARVKSTTSPSPPRKKSGVKVKFSGHVRTVYYNKKGHYIIGPKNERVYIKPEPARGMYMPGVRSRPKKRRFW